MSWKRRSDIGMTDFYNYYKDNNFGNNKESLFYLERSEFNSIVTMIFKGIKDLILYENFEFNMPSRLGILSIKKVKRNIKVIDGKVAATLPIDWKKTNELWESNPEAKEKKVLIKHINNHTNGYVCRFRYNKSKANYKNKSIYRFRAARDFARELKTALFNKKINIDFYEQ